MRLLVVVEQTDTGLSAYAPDLPGCIATGPSRGEVESRMREAIVLHLEGLNGQGLTTPESHSYATMVEVEV